MGRKSPLNQNLVKTPNGGLNDWGTQIDSVAEKEKKSHWDCRGKPALIGRIYGGVQSIGRSVPLSGRWDFCRKGRRSIRRKTRYSVGWGIGSIGLTEIWPVNWVNWMVDQSCDQSKISHLETLKWNFSLRDTKISRILKSSQGNNSCFTHRM